MRTVLLILSALLFAPSTTVMNNDDEPLVVQLRESHPADEIQRSGSQALVACFLDPDDQSITLFSKDSSTCDVEITNITLNELISYQCLLCGLPTIIPLQHTGEYHIVITMPNGICYYGDFYM